MLAAKTARVQSTSAMAVVVASVVDFFMLFNSSPDMRARHASGPLYPRLSPGFNVSLSSSRRGAYNDATLTHRRGGQVSLFFWRGRHRYRLLVHAAGRQPQHPGGLRSVPGPEEPAPAHLGGGARRHRD